MNEYELMIEAERKFREWLKDNGNHPLVNAIRNWSGERYTKAFNGDGYCEVIRAISIMMIHSEFYTSSGNHSKYKMISDIIMEEEGDLKSLVETWCERHFRRN